MTDVLAAPHTVDTATCSGEVHDQGAQVLRWAPAGAVPVLYVSTAVRRAPGTPIRAGIPVCWPWFGPGRSGGLEPAHGFLRSAPWELVDQTTTDESVVFVHRVSDETAGSPHWPYRYAVQLRSSLGAPVLPGFRWNSCVTSARSGKLSCDFCGKCRPLQVRSVSERQDV